MPRQGLLALSVVALGLLLAGCQAAPSDELDAQLSGISGVESVYVDATRVKATLVDDISAADAETAIVALHDQAIAGTDLGAGIELVVVLRAGERDFGDAQPWEVYSYGKWAAGALGGEGFAQQAKFLASLADWETLTTTPAQIRQVRFEVTGVTTVAETPAPGETPAPDATEADEPTTQTVAVKLRSTVPAEPADPPVDTAGAIATAISELQALWVASGGAPEGITIG